MFFLTAFYINIKRILKPSSFFLFCFFSLSLIIGGFIQNEMKLKISIGVLSSNDSDISREIISSLYEFSDINVIEFENFSEMEMDLSYGKIESGYVLDEDLDRYILNGTINRAVKLYKTPKTVTDGFTNELVFAALIKAAAPYIAYNYLYGANVNTSVKDMRLKVHSFYTDSILMDFDMTVVGEQKNVNTNRIITGIVSVYIFVLMFYTAIQAISSKEHGFYAKLDIQKRLLYMLAYVLSNMALVFIITAVCVPYIGSRGPLHGLLGLALYILMLGVLCVICVLAVRSSNLLYAFFPIVSVAVIVVGGAFFDIGKIDSVLGKVSYLFPTFYFTRFLH